MKKRIVLNDFGGAVVGESRGYGQQRCDAVDAGLDFDIARHGDSLVVQSALGTGCSYCENASFLLDVSHGTY
jgi:hypothetical protein